MLLSVAVFPRSKACHSLSSSSLPFYTVLPGLLGVTGCVCSPLLPCMLPSACCICSPTLSPVSCPAKEAALTHSLPALLWSFLVPFSQIWAFFPLTADNSRHPVPSLGRLVKVVRKETMTTFTYWQKDRWLLNVVTAVIDSNPHCHSTLEISIYLYNLGSFQF